jgi:hypothetical protein
MDRCGPRRNANKGGQFSLLLLLRTIEDILEATENDLIDLLEQELVLYKYTI